MSIRLLIADDHDVVRAGLLKLLADSEIEIVCQARSSDDAVTLALKHKPDVVLLDLRMKESDGLAALEKIRACLPATKVVMFSVHDNPAYIAKAHALGAHDYVLKGRSKDTLIAAITAAATDKGPIRAGEMWKLAHVRNSAANQQHDELPLTPRELQVLRHISRGMSNKEIARALEISVDTIKEHVQNLLGKLGLNHRTQAAVLAVRQGIA